MEARDQAADSLENKLDGKRDSYGQGTVDYTANVTARTAKEVGDDHVDNAKGEITVRDLESGKRKGYADISTQILGMLEKLAEKINDNINEMISDEIEASTNFAEWKMSIEAEEFELGLQRKALEQDLKDLQVLLGTAQAVLGRLSGEAETLKKSETAACTLASSTKTKNEKKLVEMKSELALFDQVYKKYEQLEKNIGQKLRGRVNQGLNKEEMTDWNR